MNVLSSNKEASHQLKSCSLCLHFDFLRHVKKGAN